MDFNVVYDACEYVAFQKFYRHNSFLFRRNQLCIPAYSVHELLVHESHSGGLMRYFGVHKTLDVLSEHIY